MLPPGLPLAGGGGPWADMVDTSDSDGGKLLAVSDGGDHVAGEQPHIGPAAATSAGSVGGAVSTSPPTVDGSGSVATAPATARQAYDFANEYKQPHPQKDLYQVLAGGYSENTLKQK